MKKITIISAILGLFVIPISLYLQFWIISQLDADRLIWFLYWIHVPVIIFVTVIQKLVEDDN